MVGLAHVDDRAQLMYPSLLTSSPAEYAAGDRTGLSKLGAPAGCFLAPAPPSATASFVPSGPERTRLP